MRERCKYTWLVLLVVAFASPNLKAQDSYPFEYGYYYEGKFTSLKASDRLIALKESRPASKQFIAEYNLLKHDSMSKNHTLRELSIYVLPEWKDFRAKLREFAKTSGEEIQPVFEMSGTYRDVKVMMIPRDEFIVKFKEDSDLIKAKAFFEPFIKEHGLVGIRNHRKNSFIVKIDSPSDGRIYQLCQSFSNFEEFRYVEPNHSVLFHKLHVIPPPDSDTLGKALEEHTTGLMTGVAVITCNREQHGERGNKTDCVLKWMRPEEFVLRLSDDGAETIFSILERWGAIIKTENRVTSFFTVFDLQMSRDDFGAPIWFFD